jgi:3-phosphoshikimate 1-carboxyvinyltransferase
MALPEFIEIVPLDHPVRAEITVPGSKSITNRALILAALADDQVTLQGALWSEDTQVMTGALQQLGFEIKVEPDPDEFCNRTITVKGLGGKTPKGGTEREPLELFVGNAGTAARFLAAFVCLGNGVYRLHGAPRMHERPQAALFKALRELGYRVEAEKGNDRLPAKIFGSAECGVRSAECTVSIEESSQFASALMLCAKAGGWKIEVVGENAEESPYVAMTSKMIEAFPHRGGKFQIEPDASSASYFWGANWLVSVASWMAVFLESTPYLDIQARFHEVWKWVKASHPPREPKLVTGDQLAMSVCHWPSSGWQIDGDFPLFIPLPDKISREGQLGDSMMTAAVLGAHLWGGVGFERREKGIRFTELQRLRLQECDRVAALRTELSKCGAEVVEEGDTLTVYPSKLHGAEIETYNDHRMAMCFAVLGLKVPGIKIKNPACVKKTFPNFFQKFATPPPKGLGATILDAKSGRKLAVEELFAE